MTQIEQDVAYIKNNFSEGVEQLKDYLGSHKLLLFFLTPKMGGKSTYIGFLKELYPEKFVVISAGDLVRNIQGLSDSEAVVKLRPIFANKTNAVLQEIREADVKKLVSDEVLYKLLLNQVGGTAPLSLILDGFPRTMAQFDLAFDLINELKPQSFVPFVLNVVCSDGVLDKRMTGRRVCPKCGLVSNMDTLQNVSTSEIKFDHPRNEFYLICPTCQISLIKKSTDTELSEMAERRATEKAVYDKMVQEAQKRQIAQTTLRTDVLVKDFSGDDQQLNLSNSYQFRPEGDSPLAEDELGQISSKTVRFTAHSPQGEVYAYHPRWVTGMIVLGINLKIRN